MFLLFLPLSFLIPSSSGLATVAMPIMAPLASFAGVPAELVVTAYQSASGIMNLFIPTSAVVMGGLAIARVPVRHLPAMGLAAAGHARRAQRGRARGRGAGHVMLPHPVVRGGDGTSKHPRSPGQPQHPTDTQGSEQA